MRLVGVFMIVVLFIFYLDSEFKNMLVYEIYETDK